MALQQITEVRTEKPHDGRYEHITYVELASGTRLARATVIANIRSVSGDRYYTYAGGKTADVIVHRCPRCDEGDYITTAPDTTPDNNLLLLPRF